MTVPSNIKEGQLIVIARGENADSRLVISRENVQLSTPESPKHLIVFDPKIGIMKTSISCHQITALTPFYIKNITKLSKISEEIRGAKINYEDFLPFLESLALQFQTIIESGFPEKYDQSTIFSSSLNYLFDTTLQEIERCYGAIYHERHDAYYAILDSMAQEIDTIEKEMSALKNQTDFWDYSYQFNYWFRQLQKEIGEMKKYELQYEKIHEMTANGCSCKFNLHMNVYQNRMNNVRKRYEYIKTLFTKYQPNGGEGLPSHLGTILKCLLEVNDRVGRNLLKLILKGSKSATLKKYNLQNNKQFGKLAHYTIELILNFINAVIDYKFIDIHGRGAHQLPFLSLSEDGYAFLKSLDAQSSQTEFLKDASVSKILTYLEYNSFRWDLIAPFVDHHRNDVIKAVFRQKIGPSFDILLDRIINVTEFFPLLLEVLFTSSTPLNNKIKIVAALQTLSKKTPENGWNALLMTFKSLEKAKIIALYEVVKAPERKQILKQIIIFKRQDILTDLVPLLRTSELLDLFDLLDNKCSSDELYSFLYPIALNKSLPLSVREKVYEKIMQIGFQLPEAPPPIDLFSSSTTEILELYHKCLPIEKKPLFQSLLEVNRIDVLEAFLLTGTKSDLNLLLEIFHSNPKESVAPLLISLLVDSNCASNIQQKALTGLKLLHDHKLLATSLMPLLAGLYPFKQRQLQKCITKIIKED